jgi:membrane-associated phospholipid phosphatase
MKFLTDFADQAVMLPMVVVVAIVLAGLGWRRGAVAWLGVIGATLGLILVLKLCVLACGPVFMPWQLRSPSGHTATAAVVFGGMVVALGGRPLAVVLAAVLAALLIGTSRLELGVHSVPEVVVGAVVGCAGAVALWRLAGRPPRARPVPLLSVALLVAVLLHGWHLPAEAAIIRVSHHALDFVPACRDHPHVRPVLPNRSEEGREGAAGSP